MLSTERPRHAADLQRRSRHAAGHSSTSSRQDNPCRAHSAPTWSNASCAFAPSSPAPRDAAANWNLASHAASYAKRTRIVDARQRPLVLSDGSTGRHARSLPRNPASRWTERCRRREARGDAVMAPCRPPGPRAARCVPALRRASAGDASGEAGSDEKQHAPHHYRRNHDCF